MSKLSQQIFIFSSFRSSDVGLSSSSEIALYDKRSLPLEDAIAASLIRPSTKKCDPVNKILFLKTHKTGSSTITNILNRYGDSRDLNMILPKSDKVFTFYWPTRFRFSFTANLFGMEPHILCNHARYNRKAMHLILPKNTSTYITILRHPLRQYESVFNFMNMAYALGYHEQRDPLATFLKFTPSGQDLRRLMKKKLSLYLIRNPMLFDLGLDFRYFQNKTAVQNYLNFIDEEFGLVMIMEYFDESLVLLKRLLCWDLEDILYFKLNERPDKKKQALLTNDVKQNIKSWNKADVLLYERFNKTLWDKIEKIGPEFYRELDTFRKKKKEVEETCLKNGTFLDEAYSGVYVKSYHLKNDVPLQMKTLCERMLRNEINYVKLFRFKRTNRIWDLEEPEETLNDPKNDWDQGGNDFDHDPET